MTSHRAGRDARQDGTNPPPSGPILPKRVVDSIALGPGGNRKGRGAPNHSRSPVAVRSGHPSKTVTNRMPHTDALRSGTL